MCWERPVWTLGIGTLELALGVVLEVEHPMYRLLLQP